MTPTPSTPRRSDIVYAIMADQRERDPIVDPADANRATVPLGRGFALWQRMNQGAQLVWVDDMEGRPRALTPKQAQVLSLALEMADGVGYTMREMALLLKVAPSTVSRALTKLAAWGLIAYLVGRGRLAGLVIFKRAKDDGLDRFRQAAKARVQRWSQAAKERVSRLWINVAPYIYEEGRGTTSIKTHYYSSTITKDATLTTQLPWTVQELRDSGII